MIISTIPASNCTPQTIVIGRRGTYDTLQIAFDLSYLVESYGNGVAVLAVKRSQDESAYPAVTTQADNTLTWTVSETDTAYVGSGECQLMWYVDGGLAKTIIYPMVVMRDILQTAEQPPDGYENWIEHLTELGAETQQNAQNAAQSASDAEDAKDDAVTAKEAAEEAAETAQEAVVHAPIIQNGYWYIWNDGQYVDTGVRAEGQKGDKGDTGEKGDTGNGIASITKTGTSGLVDTYTVTYTDGTTTTFTVTNGAKGDKGDTGATGNGIQSITKTGTSGNVDTYTITYTNGQTTTFTVTNGAVSSVNGKTGAVNLASGDIAYDESATYQAGSVGAELQEQTRQISDVESALNGETTYNYVTNKNLDTTGELIDETGTCVSEYIPYTWTGATSYDCGDNTKLTYRIEFYDANKDHITGFRNPSSIGGVTYRGVNVETQVTGGTVAYVRFSFKQGTVGRIFKSAINVLWVAESVSSGGLINDVGNLEELDTTDKSNIVEAINEVNAKVPDITLPIKPKDTDFFYVSPNIADPSAFVANEFVNQTNGVFTSYSGQTRTGFIPVTPGKTYCIVNSADFNAGIRYAFYSSTSESAYLSGANVNLDDVGNLVTAPTDAAYMVMSANTSRFPFMVAESNTKIDYAEYGDTYLLPEYVLDEDVDDIPVNLPSKIYALVGYELNIYFENIVEDYTQFNFDVTCTKGMQLERGYQITPTDSDVGTYPLSIVISSKDGRSSKAATTTLIVASASAGSGVTEKVLVLGDSTTNSGYAVTKLAQNLADDPMGITLLGTRGTAPYMHEGRSGWTFNLYFTSAGSGSVLNPFYNPNTQTFDASYYFSNTGVAVPDWFIINLGINDTFSYTTDSALESAIPTIKGLCDAMIASVKAVSSAIKIGLCVTIPPNHSQDAFGKAYDCGQTRNRYKRNNILWANELIKEYDGRESEQIYLIPIYTNLDTVWNMGMEALPVNARNTTVTYQSPIGNGGVHPAENGYWQIADVYTAFLKANA